MGRVIYFKDYYAKALLEMKKAGADIKTPIQAIRYDRYLKQTEIGDWIYDYILADLTGRRSMLSKIIDRVTVTKSGITIDYKIEVNTFIENSVESFFMPYLWD